MKRLIILLCAFFLLFSACARKPVQAKISAVIQDSQLVYSEGIVTMDGKEITIGTLIIDGSVLKTNADGVAEIVFNEKNIIKMGPDTALRLQVSSLKRIVYVDNGTFTAVLRKLDKLSGGSLEVKTPTAVAGVRGTSFFARVESGGNETYFCTCNGTLRMSADDGSSPVTKTATHHDGTIFKGSSGSVAIIPAPPGFDVGHSDKDLEVLASRIGETIDWTKLEE